MSRSPALLLLVVTCVACLAHEDESATPTSEPTPEATRDRIAAASPRAEPARADEAPAEASFESLPTDPDPDMRDAPIPPTTAARPPVGASLPADAEIAREALAHGEAGEPQKMRAAWLRLVRDHPTSPYVPLAYAAFGDHYFTAGDFEAAAKLYDKVLQFPDTAVRGWALYKLAWSNLQRGDGAGALDRFVQTLRAIEAGHAGNAAEAETLAAATRRDLVIAYAMVGKPDKAAPFFQRLGTGAAADEVPPAKMLDLLGRRLTKDGKAAEASVVCEAMKAADVRASCAW